MCGINGIFAYGDAAPLVVEAELLRTREYMVRRGPDGAGLWMSADRRVGLAHRRLAIIDLSETGAQPMATADGRLTITFNGEIYNYRALRRELEAKGYVFRSQSDTEVLLHLYADRGAEMVHALRGMFAFGIWDARDQSLFLARDPFGIKPLYYSDAGGTFRFASQVKALLAGNCIDRRPEPAGSVGFLIWGSVPEPFTLYSAIRALPAGCSLFVKRDRGPVVNRFFDIRAELANAEQCKDPIADMQEILGEAVRDSVRHHLIADVPVGVFLSSGIDSSTVVALAAREEASKLHTITLGFREFRGTQADETLIAQDVATQFGTSHLTRWMTRSDFLAAHDKILESMDQPSTDGVNTYLISAAAAEAGMKVAISGIGGDELFGGYPSFSDVPRLQRWASFATRMGDFGGRVRKIVAPVLRHVTSPKFSSLLEYGGTYGGAYLLRRALYLPWELGEILEPSVVAEGLGRLGTLEALGNSVRGINTPRSIVTALETQWYLRNQLLRDADWAAMAHSLEIRTPLVDVNLFRSVARYLSLKTPPSKESLAAIPRSLPKQVVQRTKSGFAVPVREWSEGARKRRRSDRGLRRWALQVLPDCPRGRVLALVTDAFGGRGGIALYNRDLLTALCEMPETRQVIWVPRLQTNAAEALPAKLTQVRGSLGGKGNFTLAVLRQLIFGRRIDFVLCCHINLLPIAIAAKWLTGSPIVLWIFGIDAWTPPRGFLIRTCIRHTDFVAAISSVTAERFSTWSGIDSGRIHVVPNAVHLEWYGVGVKDERLIERYGLRGKTVLMTMGRLASRERYKGIDEVLDVLPQLVAERPNLVYLVVGDGSDLARLEAKVQELGMSGHVIFTGFVSEEQKAAHFRLADLYVMPSRGEGFGFVLLEAMACGVNVVASTMDGTREAVRGGLLGKLVNPDRPSELIQAISEGLCAPSGNIPQGLEHFSFTKFRHRIRSLALQEKWL